MLRKCIYIETNEQLHKYEITLTLALAIYSCIACIHTMGVGLCDSALYVCVRIFFVFLVPTPGDCEEREKRPRHSAEKEREREIVIIISMCWLLILSEWVASSTDTAKRMNSSQLVSMASKPYRYLLRSVAEWDMHCAQSMYILKTTAYTIHTHVRSADGLHRAAYCMCTCVLFAVVLLCSHKVSISDSALLRSNIDTAWPHAVEHAWIA